MSWSCNRVGISGKHCWRTTHILWILINLKQLSSFLFSLTRENSGDRYMLTVKTLQVKPSWLSWVSPLGRKILKYSQPHNRMIPAITV